MRLPTTAMSSAVAVASAASALVLSCGQILGVSGWVDVGAFDGSTNGADAGGRDGGGATDGSAPADGSPLDAGLPGVDAGPCRSPVEGGADGVLVTGEFCIDTTEAPVRLYRAFLDDPTVDPATGQPPECGWNGSYQPAYDAYSGDPQAADKPQTAIDWCDALAFCVHWGKRLCGNRLDAGAVDPTAPLENGQWYQACTGGAVGQAYPYGPSYDASRCRTGLGASAGAGVVPTSARCQGGVSGLFDMSGNVQEWENSCIPSDAGDASADLCVQRGGTWFFPTDSVTCDLRSGGALGARGGSNTSADGIRCCWEPR